MSDSTKTVLEAPTESLSKFLLGRAGYRVHEVSRGTKLCQKGQTGLEQDHKQRDDLWTVVSSEKRGTRETRLFANLLLSTPLWLQNSLYI